MPLATHELRDSASQIVQRCGMIARPEVYSGRGATTSDLSGEILKKIHANVESVCGKSAATQFEKMVAEIPNLSATAFLENLYLLAGNGWKWQSGMLRASGTASDFTNEASLLASCIGTAFSRGHDDTAQIRGSFFHAIGKPNPCAKQEIGHSFTFYRESPAENSVRPKRSESGSSAEKYRVEVTSDEIRFPTDLINAPLAFRDRVDLSKMALGETIGRFTALDPLYVTEHNLDQAINTACSKLPTNFAKALKVVFDSYRREQEGKNPVLQFGNIENPRLALVAALKTLNFRYNQTVDAPGEFKGTDRGDWSVFDTQFGEVTRLNDHCETSKHSYGPKLTEKGMRIGDTVTVNSKQHGYKLGVIVNASNTFGGLGQGTCTIAVLERGAREAILIPPWLVTPVENIK